jgi:hypothetical protein
MKAKIQWIGGTMEPYKRGYAAGLRDGAKRERRALRRFSKRNPAPGFDYYVKQWLTARLKEKK